MKKHNETKQQPAEEKTRPDTVTENELSDHELDEVAGGGLKNLVKGNGPRVLALGPKQDDPRDIGNY